jgi:ubiquinone/menaquinone biosynthesis C-methylase UbiE
MAFISFSDFTDLWFKLRERGAGYAARKLVSDAESRIRSTWDDDNLPGSNWWQIDEVRKRWNKLITGNEHLIYPDYVAQTFLAGKYGLKMLSIGCGTGQREVEFAKHVCFSAIDAFDIAPRAIDDARKTAQDKKLTNCNFFLGDVYKDEWPPQHYDVVLFHSSLHHFRDINGLLRKVNAALKPGGLIIINEYVGANRFQFSPVRKKKVSEIYKGQVPVEFKKRKSGPVKTDVYFPGLLRMIISDPSEAVESASILPVMNRHFRLIEQKNYGGNLLTFILKDIAHHFNSPGSLPVLQNLFKIEDELMSLEKESDFVFAVYEKASAVRS